MEQSRRTFIRASAAAAGAVGLSSMASGKPIAPVKGSDEIRIGVVGAGGRGKGACVDSMSSSEGIRLVAIGELTFDLARGARDTLKNTRVAAQVDVPDGNLFSGLDAYRQVINHDGVDLVILTTSPGFRPLHIAEAVRAGKHIFAEKPVCVDPAGYRSCLASAAQARKQGTAIVTGTMYRRQPSYVQAVERIYKGEIGRFIGGLAYYCSTGIWYRQRKPEMTDMQYQLYNWYHFVWLSGDQIVEQAVHNLDAINWIMGGPPVRAFGSGGQMTRPSDSEIYDHIDIDYEYANGAIISFKCRQIPGATPRVINTIVGTDGKAFVNPGEAHVVDASGNETFRLKHGGINPYVQEHKELVESIRSGNPLVELEDTAASSLTAVMGRMAAYSGKEVTWDFVTKSEHRLMPDMGAISFDTPITSPGVQIPGQFKLI
jgi:predicted dehydrogenase